MKKRAALFLTLFVLLSFSVFAQGRIVDGGGLQITEVTVSVDGQKQIDVDFNDDLKAIAHPGSEIIVDVEITNLKTFDLIENILLELEVLNLGGVTIQQEVRPPDLRREQRQTIRFKFTVPESTESDTYRIQIDAKGIQDRRFTRHKAEFSVFFAVEQVDKQPPTVSTKVNKQSIRCGNDVLIQTMISESMFESFQSGRVTITSVPLDLFEEFSFNLERNQDFRKTTIHEVPEDLKEGTYNIFTTFNVGTERIEKRVTLDVICPKKPVVKEDQAIVSITPAVVTEIPEEEKKGGSYWLLIGLFFLVLLLLLIIWIIS